MKYWTGFFLFILMGLLLQGQTNTNQNTRQITSMSGTYTIDNTLPTTAPATPGGNFASFTAAINALNSDSITGSIIINVSAGQEFLENPPEINCLGNTYDIIFQRSGSGNNPVIRPTGSSSMNEGAINLVGADYFTFDGIDISIRFGSSLECGYVIENESAWDGAQHNTIKNCTITLNKANTMGRGVFQATLLPVFAFSGSNSYNTYKNITVYNCNQGIELIADRDFPDIDCHVDSNTIGGLPPNDIGDIFIRSCGIKAKNLEDFSIIGNTVSNVSSTGNYACGIFVENTFGTNTVANNIIYDITVATQDEDKIVYGIYVIDSIGTTLVSNNMLSQITHERSTPTTNFIVRGISVYTATLGTVNVFYNSVQINEDDNASVAAFYMEDGTVSILNNILSNVSDTSSSSFRYCIYKNNGVLSSDFNDLHIDTSGTNNYTGYDGSNYIGLSDWQTGSGDDYSSLNITPPFISATNLHIIATDSAVNNLGTPCTVLYDIDQDSRDAVTPDIGADEYTYTTTDLAMYSVSAPVAGCMTSAETVVVLIENTGLDTIYCSVTPVQINVNVTGANTDATSIIVNTGTFDPGTISPFTVGTVDLRQYGENFFDAYLSCSADAFFFNDTLLEQDTILTNNPYIYSFYPTEDSICLGSGAQLGALYGGADGMFAVTEFINDSVKLIPDNDINGISYYFDVNIDVPANSIHYVYIDSLIHLSDEDLNIYLFAPDGSGIELSTDNGGSDDNYIHTYFKETALNTITTATPPMSGYYQPEESFMNLTGSSLGLWKIKIVDDQTSNTGLVYKTRLAFLSSDPYTYTWWPSGTLNDSTFANPTSTITTNTMYYHQVSVSGCESLIDSIYIVVLDTPSVNLGTDQTICDTTTIILDAGNMGSTYNWSTGGTTQTDTIPGSSLRNRKNDVSVIVTNAYGCTDTDTVNIEVIVCSNIEEPEQYVLIYPNPVKDVLVLDLGSTKTGQYVFAMEDMNGKTVVNKEFNYENSPVKIQLTPAESGIYIIKVTGEDAVYTTKCIIE